MASLYFYYSTMNAGKSTQLLQAAYNYEEHGRVVWVIKPKLDHRDGVGVVSSRIGLRREVETFEGEDDLYEWFKKVQASSSQTIVAVFVDEAQFLTQDQVRQLSDIVDTMKIPVLCYGLRTDAFGHLFPGSAALLGWADNVLEIKAMCQYCTSKATMAFRVNEHDLIVGDGNSIEIGGNDRYHACCRRHWKQALNLVGQPSHLLQK